MKVAVVTEYGGNKKKRKSERQSAAEYGVWAAMKQRCYNKKTSGYERYGGRGIKVCKRWHKYDNFIMDMGKRPSEKHSLDRVDVNGDYCPGNCRWATAEQQQRNTTKNINVEINGVIKCISEWAMEFGINRHCIQSRLRKGISPFEAVTKPSDKARYKPVIKLTYNGQTKTLTEWSRLTGIDKVTLWGRIYRSGWSIKEAMTVPTTDLTYKYSRR